MQILGLRASQELGIIKIIVLNVTNNTTESIINQHPALFKGLGCPKIPYKIQIDTSVPPVIVSPKNQPAPLREYFKQANS